MTTPDTAAVFIVDDDDAIRDSLGLLIRMNGYEIRAYASAEEFLDAVTPDYRGCVVADVRMPGLSGVEMIGRMRAMGVDLPVIIITGHGDVPMAVAALKAGASDFIEKPYQDQILLERVREAMAANDTAAADSRLRHEIRQRMDSLSPRENEVLELVVAGHSNKIVAARLGISIRTVEIHRARVMEKTGARSLSELVRLSMLAGTDDSGRLPASVAMGR